MTRSVWQPFLISTGIYVLLTVVFGWDALTHLGTHLIHDEFDPLLIAAILQWNATHVPFTSAWWQFPIFSPAPDVLAFSEHLLGVSLLSTPLSWLTGDAVETANLTVLATFPLCAMTAYALARHLTGSVPAAFVAGLVYGFGPFRMAQLAHLQMLSAQWIPLALLALHLHLQTARRRWLVLFGAAWLIQALSNGYALFILSVFVGLWLAWFVVVQQRWRALVHIAAALVVATLPLVPILWTYRMAHVRNGFSRGPVEVVAFSADALGVLCSPTEVSAWGWLRVACRPEGELFPGFVTLALCVGALFLIRSRIPAVGRWAVWRLWLQRLALGVGLVEMASSVSTMVIGPWRLALGPLSARGTSTSRAFMIGTVAFALAFVLSRGGREAWRRGTAIGFYVVAGVLMWWCSLGPSPVVLGDAADLPGPFTLLMPLPGFSSLRVPGRFWMMATLCLSVVVAFAVARLMDRGLGRWRRPLLVALSLGVLADGWELHPSYGAVPPGPPNGELLRGSRVLYLPAGSYQDVVPTYYSVVQGWTSVNGYSGFEPTHYDAVRQASRLELDGTFSYFRADGDLHVVVPLDAPRLLALVERQPGAALTASSATARQYRLPRLASPVIPRAEPTRSLAVETVDSSCQPASVLADGRLDGIWTCEPQMGNETITLTLREPASVSGVRMTLGRRVEFPRLLLIEVSMDGEAWTTARTGDVLREFIIGAHAAPTQPSLVVAFDPVSARFVRLRQVGQDPMAAWSLREVEILTAAPASR